MKRICIYPSDVEAITGKSKKTAQTLVRTIKDVYQKEKHQVVTIREFCEYMGLEYDDVFNEINNINKKRPA
ncbi:hypothetical protein [Corallibacter sp.]|uniref:hypothetical protein n=1 Tax=Corallibacter sp. TaxID=2038084 RepID=UPI003A913F8F